VRPFCEIRAVVTAGAASVVVVFFGVFFVADFFDVTAGPSTHRRAAPP